MAVCNARALRRGSAGEIVHRAILQLFVVVRTVLSRPVPPPPFVFLCFSKLSTLFHSILKVLQMLVWVNVLFAVNK